MQQLLNLLRYEKNPAMAVPWRDAGLRREAYLPQLSLSVVTRLKTGLPGVESTRSATK